MLLHVVQLRQVLASPAAVLLYAALTHAGDDLWATHAKVAADICRANSDDVSQQACEGRAAVDMQPSWQWDLSCCYAGVECHGS